MMSLVVLVLWLRLASAPAWVFVDHSPDATVRDCVRLTEQSSACLVTEAGRTIELDQPCGPNIVAVLHWNEGGMMQTKVIERNNRCVYRFPSVFGGS